MSGSLQRAVALTAAFVLLAAVEHAAQRCPDSRLVTVCDREADIYELFELAHRQGRELLVRAMQDRGLLHGDVVVALDGKPVTGVDDLIRMLTADLIGRPAAVDVLRLGKLKRFRVTPTERPRERNAPVRG